MGGHLCDGNGAVDDLTIGLSCGHIEDDILVALLIDDAGTDGGGIIRTGGSVLNRDDLSPHILKGLDVGVNRCDDDLVDVGIRQGETDALGPLLAYSETGGSDIGFTLGNGHEDGIEAVLSELHFISHIVTDGTDYIHIDPDELTAVHVVEGCEIGTGLNDEDILLLASEDRIGSGSDDHYRDDSYHRDQLFSFHYIDQYLGWIFWSVDIS